MARRLSIVIPVFNEARYIDQVLERLRELPISREIIVVDDGSTDGTRERLQELRQQWSPDDLIIHFLAENRGKGYALREGIARASGDVVAIQDADFEYDPSELPELAAPIFEQRSRVVYGSRFRGTIQNMAPLNRAFNRVISTFASILYGQRITDEATCYKLFETPFLKSIPLQCERFEFCPEVTAKVRRRGERILELPIRYVGRTTLEGKKIRWWDGVVALWTLLRYRFWRG